jgi:hypothetical protein
MRIVNESNPDPRFPLLTTPPGVRPRRRWLWRWSFRVFLALLAVVAVLFLYYAHRRREALVALRAAVAELDRTEPGWRLNDLEAARAPVPDDQNSALVLIEAYRSLPPGWEPDKTLERVKDLPPNMRLDDQEATDLREELAELQPALHETQKITTLPNGRYPANWLRDLTAFDLHDVQHARRLMSLLQCGLLVQAQDGDLRGALRSCRALLNVARSIGDEPLAISQLVRIAGIGIVYKSTERVLNQGDPRGEDLLSLQRLMEEEERFPRLLVSLRGERAYMHAVAEAMEAGDVRPRDHAPGPASRWDWVGEMVVMDMFRAAHPNLLALHTEGVKLAALPAHQRVQPMKNLEAKWRRQPGVERGLFPIAAVFDKAARRIDGQLRCVITAVAVERYRGQYDRLPDTLDQLVPDYLAEVPIDPFDGEPLGYQRLDDRIVVYSRCPIITLNALDAGEQAYDPDDPSPPGVGLAVHLYDVKHRRRPFAELLPPPAMDDEPNIRGIDP